MNLKLSNFAKAKLATPPSGTTGLSFSVESGKGALFEPLSGGEYTYGVFVNASKNREVVKIEARSTDSFTIASGGRGLDGTTALTWSAGDYFYVGNVKIILQEIAAIAEDHIADGSAAHAASAISYSGATSGLSATDIQAAIDELDAIVDALVGGSFGTLAYINSPCPVLNGGTGATDADTARTNLGLGTIATQAASAVAITGGSVNAATMRRNGNNLWGPDNDGPGTGLDADTLDGQHASAFALSGHTHAYLSSISNVGTTSLVHNGAAGQLKGLTVANGGETGVNLGISGLSFSVSGNDVRLVYTTSSGGSCFPKFTAVHTERGVMAIQDIRVGDRVLDREGRPRKVLGLHRPKVGARWMWDLGDLLTTGDHLFYTPFGWACVEPAVYQTLREARHTEIRDHSDDWIGEPGARPVVATILAGPVPSFEIRRLRRFFPVLTRAGTRFLRQPKRVRRLANETLYGLWVEGGVYAVGSRGYLVDGFPQE